MTVNATADGVGGDVSPRAGGWPPRSLSFRNLLVLNEYDIRNGFVAAVVGRRHGRGRKDFEILQCFRGSEAREWQSDCWPVRNWLYAETHVLEFHEGVWRREVERR